MKTLKICTCGHSIVPHEYRHLPVPINIQISTDDNGPIFHINALNYPQTKKTSKCTVPQCGRGESLHGTILKHDFKGESYMERKINFEIPIHTKCRVLNCGLPYNNHKVRHQFVCKVEIQNKEETDKLIIINDKPVIVD